MRHSHRHRRWYTRRCRCTEQGWPPKNSPQPQCNCHPYTDCRHRTKSTRRDTHPLHRSRQSYSDRRRRTPPCLLPPRSRPPGCSCRRCTGCRHCTPQTHQAGTDRGPCRRRRPCRRCHRCIRRLATARRRTPSRPDSYPPYTGCHRHSWSVHPAGTRRPRRYRRWCTGCRLRRARRLRCRHIRQGDCSCRLCTTCCHCTLLA